MVATDFVDELFQSITHASEFRCFCEKRQVGDFFFLIRPRLDPHRWKSFAMTDVQ